MASSSQQFTFPNADSKILPKPTKFLSPKLLQSPLPTHSFFQNFFVKTGDQPVFLHPYMVKLSLSSFSACYPSITATSSTVSQDFSPDFTISTSKSSKHLISSFSDLTVNIDFESSGLRYILARGSPYITLEISKPNCVTFSVKSGIKSVSSSKNNTKHKIELEDDQTWIVYSSTELILRKNDQNVLSTASFVGIIRVANKPNNGSKSEETLDLYKSCYPKKGEAVFSDSFKLEYKWETEGWGELLMLAHPLHLNLISSIHNNSKIRVLSNFKYKSIDGELVGVVGNSWRLRAPNLPITWHSFRGIPINFHPEIVASLWKDVGGLDSSSISTTHDSTDVKVLFYGFRIFRAARLALISEEVNCKEVIPAIKKFLRDTITPWLEGKLEGNGFVYEPNWGGILTKQALTNDDSDDGFGWFDNHYYLGYFVYAIAVLAKLDPEWGSKFRGQAYSLVGSLMNSGSTAKSKYVKLRSFDLYKLHSWKGIVENGECNSHCPSEHILVYYAASLLGMAYGDDHLTGIGSTLASFEIEATKTWFHVREGGVYGEEFSKENKLVGISWMSKREDLLFFAPAEHKEFRTGMHVLPVLPITEILFSDVGFVRDVVEWAMSSLDRTDAVDDGWIGFVYALEAIYDQKNALKMIKKLTDQNCGHRSLTDSLWWVYSRGEREKFCSWCSKVASECWFCAYCG